MDKIIKSTKPKKPRNVVKYSDKRTLMEGTNTVVKGSVTLSEVREAQITKLLVDAVRAFDDVLGRSVECTGVAHLSDKDTFNELTGKIIASRKAEIKGNEKVMRAYNRTLAALNAASVLIKEDLQDIDKHVDVISKNLSEYK
jgi:hypothetical protein